MQCLPIGVSVKITALAEVYGVTTSITLTTPPQAIGNTQFVWQRMKALHPTRYEKFLRTILLVSVKIGSDFSILFETLGLADLY